MFTMAHEGGLNVRYVGYTLVTELMICGLRTVLSLLEKMILWYDSLVEKRIDTTVFKNKSKIKIKDP